MFKKFSLQFGKPHGFLGRIAGKLMSKGAEKSKWTISLLNIQRNDNVLEVGFGPGVGIELVSKAIDGGIIVGIDYSDVMLKQATKRNIEAIEDGTVKLMLADANDLPSFDLMFDKVFSVNSIIFWKNPVETLKRIRQFMNSNGLISLTIQPYIKGATEETVKQMGQELVNYLTEAGFSDIRLELKSMKPIGAVCVLGANR